MTPVCYRLHLGIFFVELHQQDAHAYQAYIYDNPSLLPRISYHKGRAKLKGSDKLLYYSLRLECPSHTIILRIMCIGGNHKASTLIDRIQQQMAIPKNQHTCFTIVKECFRSSSETTSSGSLERILLPAHDSREVFLAEKKYTSYALCTSYG